MEGGLVFQALRSVGGVTLDVIPVVALLVGFQVFVLRKPFGEFRKKIVGLSFVIIGMAFFLVGLESALFPLGRAIAEQLSDPDFLGLVAGAPTDPSNYVWVYAFAATIGFATTVAEPALITVSLKAEEVSAGTISAVWLRVAVALGVAFGVTVGTWRIVTGTPIHWYIIAGYLVVAVQTWRAERRIIPLAYDTGGVTTSTVTVPVISALGISLASTIPGRSPLIDGFGLIALASLFPIIFVLGYSSLATFVRCRRLAAISREEL